MRGLSEPHAGMGRECGRNTNGVWMWGRRDRPGTGGSAPLRHASLPCNRKPVGRVEKSGCTARPPRPSSRGCPKQFCRCRWFKRMRNTTHQFARRYSIALSSSVKTSEFGIRILI